MGKIINATDLPRFMQCKGSIRYPVHEREEQSESAREGDAAHLLAAMLLRGEISDSTDMVDRSLSNGVFVTEEMASHVADYVEVLTGRGIKSDSGRIEVLSDLRMDDHGSNIRCRPDYIVYDYKIETLYVDDFKYGWRIVEPENNWVLIAYALAYIENDPARKMPANIVFTIHQPRPYHQDGPVREWEITTDELNTYHERIVNAFSHVTLPGISELYTGENCHYCPALAICPAARDASMNAMEAAGHFVIDDMENDVIGFHYGQLSRAETIIKDRKDAIEELMKHRLKHGAAIDGYSLTLSVGNLKWNKDVDAATLEALTGKDLTTAKLVTPSQAKKLGVVEEIINTFASRQQTGVKLIQEDVNKRAQRLLTGAK